MDEYCHGGGEKTTGQTRHSRDEVIGHVISFELALEKLGLSQRQYALIHEIPRSTFQGWVKRKAAIDAPPALVEFFETPEGLAFLHQIVVAAQLVITQTSAGSIRQLCAFLTLSGLSVFVASSYGVQQEAVKAMERQIVSFGKLELERLGKLMRPKKITILEDETFHPQICLVAMDGASGFIFLEMYADSRDSKTWATALRAALGDLPVEVVQVTSDEAKALIRHAEVELSANHSPDLFHVIHELFKGTSLSMAREVRTAREAVDEARQVTERLEESRTMYMESEAPSPYCSLTAMQRNIDDAKAKETLAEASFEEARQQQQDMADAIRGISDCYHPFDLETGVARSAEKVDADIKGKFERIDELAEQVSLSDSGVEHIDKARRVVAAMITTVTFFHRTIGNWIEQLCLPEPLEQFIVERWIPARYIELVAERATDSETRVRLRQAAAKLMPSPQHIGSMLSSLCDNDRLLIAYTVEQCAQLFQRSSSAVEGRNGHLSLFHHGHHRLPETKLAARTVIHNYMKLRPDATTAAERFFGHPPQDLFQWLLERMSPPSRPAKPRLKLVA